jgi:hypothetical protein
MKKQILFLILFLSISSYAIEKNLSCNGSVEASGPVENGISNKTPNITFDDNGPITDLGLIITGDDLNCFSEQVVSNRVYNKNEISYLSRSRNETSGTEGFCQINLRLNRNTGSLTYKRIENWSGKFQIYSGKFKCEVAKPKF